MGWLLILQAVNIVLPFVTVPYVTRVFGVDLYGVFSLALNWITYFQLVVEFGFNLSATKKVVGLKTKKERSDLVSAVVAARLLLVALCLVVVAGLGLATLASGTQLECMLVLFSMLFGIALQLNWLFQGLQDMKVITVSTAAARGLSVLLIFMLVNDSSQLVLYSFLYSITFLASGVFTHAVAWKKYGIRISRTSMKSVLHEMRDGTPIFLSSAAGKIISNVGITVLGACQSPAIVGSYAAVLKIPQMASLMFTPVGQALYPRVNEECLRSKTAAIRLVAKFGLPVVVLFGLGLTTTVLIREPLTALLFGDQYIVAADALIPLAIWVLFGIINNFLGVQLLIPFGYQRLYSILMIADSLLALVLNIALGPVYGFMGVAAAIGISEVLLSVALAITLAMIIAPGKPGSFTGKAE